MTWKRLISAVTETDSDTSQVLTRRGKDVVRRETTLSRTKHYIIPNEAPARTSVLEYLLDPQALAH